jgi:hypothetical protein
MLEFISTGSTYINKDDKNVMGDLKVLFKSLEINFELIESSIPNIKVEEEDDNDVQCVFFVCHLCDQAFEDACGLAQHRQLHSLESIPSEMARSKSRNFSLDISRTQYSNLDRSGILHNSLDRSGTWHESLDKSRAQNGSLDGSRTQYNNLDSFGTRHENLDKSRAQNGSLDKARAQNASLDGSRAENDNLVTFETQYGSLNGPNSHKGSLVRSGTQYDSLTSSCYICDQEFVSADDLTEHLRFHLPMSPIKTINDESFFFLINQDFKLESQLEIVEFEKPLSEEQKIESNFASSQNIGLYCSPQNSTSQSIDILDAINGNTVNMTSDKNPETPIEYPRFKCDDCDKEFLLSVALRSHRKNKCQNSKIQQLPQQQIKMTANLGTKNNSEENKKKIIHSQIVEIFNYTCSDCVFSNNQLANLRTHIASLHFRKEMMQHFGNATGLCKLCDKVFPTEQQLLSHLANKHKALKGLISDQYYPQSSSRKKANKRSASLNSLMVNISLNLQLKNLMQ